MQSRRIRQMKEVFNYLLLSLLLGYVSMETRVVVKIKMKEYHVNGRNWDGDRCDIIINPECDPEFFFCIDKHNGNSNPQSCAYVSKGWSYHYQGQNSVYFGSKIERSISNPITATIKDWQGAFRFKVHVRNDNFWDPDDIDKFNYRHASTPDRSSSSAKVTSKTIYGTRPRDKSRFKLEIRVYCANNWYQEDCSVNCVAKNSNTEGYYTCHSDTGEKVCRPGWETPEENCLVKKDDCEDNNCVNGATCVDMYKNYTCDCMQGYTGVHCETEIDECASDPCLHGGECLDELNSYRCLCRDAFTGDHCEHHVCSLEDYCQNGGTCYDDGQDKVNCICPEPYLGKHCDVHRCDITKCENGGSCVEGVCICTPAYVGDLCQHLFCDQITCHNGGNCSTDVCVCQPGFEGRYCEVYINYCESSPCLNEGVCRNYTNGFECSCQSGYNGTRCELDWTEQNKNISSKIIWASVATIAILCLLIVGFAVYVAKRCQKGKLVKGKVVPSDNESTPSQLGRDTSAKCPSTPVAISMGTGFFEKVPFPYLERDSRPPPPYSCSNGLTCRDLENAEICPSKPPCYSEAMTSGDHLEIHSEQDIQKCSV